jgi:hypothetical protein
MALHRPIAELGKVIWETSDEQSGTARPHAPGTPFKDLHMNFARGIVATTIGILALLAVSSISGCPSGSSPSGGGAPDPGTEDTGGGGPECEDTCEFASDGECDDGRAGAVTGACAPGTDCTDCGPVDFGDGGQTSDAEVIFDNSNGWLVANSPTAAAEFTTQRTYRVTLIRNYHWNDGAGSATVGTVALRDAIGTTYGPWQAVGSDGAGGSSKNLYWEAAPDTLIPPGTYTVIDSDTATWAQNATTGNAGMTHVEGVWVTTGGDPGTPEPTAPTLDLSVGGDIDAGAGVTITALPASATGKITVQATAGGAAGALDDEGYVASREYDITATGLTGKTLIAPLIVTLPVDVSGIPEPVDAHGFSVEILDSATGAWIAATGVIPYDAGAGTISFPTTHFSKYRVFYVGLIQESELNYLDWFNNAQLNKYTYATDHFVVVYYLPAVFGQNSRHVVVDNPTWGTGGGHATDPNVPDYVEDVAFSLEQAHQYLTGLTANGSNVFDDPGRVTCQLMYIADASGKFSWWEDNLIRIRPRLDNFNDLQTTVAHELTHLFSTQHYNFAGAVSNRWFYEAVANWWSVRASKLGRADMLTVFRDGISTFIAEPLDSASEGSMYAAGDFLYALTNAVPGFDAANVILSGASADLAALEQVLAGLNTPLGEIFTAYVQQNCVGTYDLSPGYLKFPKRLTTAELAWHHDFTQNHLSGHYVELGCDEAVDGMLVAATGCGSTDWPFSTYSYADTTPPPARADVNTYLENPNAPQASIAVAHFGKMGTTGVNYSILRQVFVNAHTDTGYDSTGADYDDIACGTDYYLLEPPGLSSGAWPANGVAWVFGASNIDPSYLTGFNVYLNNKKINDNLIPYTDEQSYSYTSAANPITSRTGVTVTIVDKFGHEWPEVQVQVNVSIQPSEVSRPLGSTDTVLFQAVVTGAIGLSNEVTWSIAEASGGGTITALGVYDPSSAVVGDYHVVATSKADPTKSATALVHITGPVTIPFSGTITREEKVGFTIPGVFDHAYNYTISASGTVTASRLTESEELTAEYTGDGYLYLPNANRSQPITLSGTADCVIDATTYTQFVDIDDGFVHPLSYNGYVEYTFDKKRYTHILYAADGSVKSTEEKATGAFAFNLAKDENAEVQAQLDFTTKTYIYDGAGLAVPYGGPGTATTTYTVFTTK